MAGYKAFGSGPLHRRLHFDQQGFIRGAAFDGGQPVLDGAVRDGREVFVGAGAPRQLGQGSKFTSPHTDFQAEFVCTEPFPGKEDICG